MIPIEEKCSNFGFVSAWFPSNQNWNLKEYVKPGDRLEFERGGYFHWAVFIGEYKLGDNIVECVVHRANNSNGLSSSHSFHKGAFGVGDVVIEPLLDVWSSSNVRINNSVDKSHRPYSAKVVIERATSAASGISLSRILTD